MKRILIGARFGEYGGQMRALTTASFPDFLAENGSLPLMAMPPMNLGSLEDGAELARMYLEHCDGVLIQGGEDIDPKWYGERNEHAHACSPWRDVFELALVRESINAGKPIFGVCRGCQVINVALGGSLHQHLDGGKWEKHFDWGDPKAQYPQAGGWGELTHKVIIEPNGLFDRLFGREQLEVNSYHHQGIKCLAPELRVEVRAPDGLVEAYSNIDKGIIAVQWHPEMNFRTDNHYGKLIIWWLTNCC